MARTAILRAYGYCNDYPRCQDYELHVRLAKLFAVSLDENSWPYARNLLLRRGIEICTAKYHSQRNGLGNTMCTAIEERYAKGRK